MTPGPVRPSRPAAGLLDAEPDLARSLSEEERRVAERFALPLAIAEKDRDVERVLEDAGAFGALVLDGLLVQAMTVDTQRTLRLIGPGGIVPVAREPRFIPSQTSCLVTATRSELVLLGDEFLLASRRWPWLVDSLHARMMEQSERLMTQLAISHLPRVEDRLLAMMWLLAEKWGHVTPAGVRLSLSLSHETLGELIGARRPTVTLAVKKLAERNALLRHDHEWLIVEQPPQQVARALQIPISISEQHQSTHSTPAAESESDSNQRHGPSEDLTRVLEDCAHTRELAVKLCSRSAQLCGRSRELNRASRAARRRQSRVRVRGTGGRQPAERRRIAA